MASSIMRFRFSHSIILIPVVFLSFFFIYPLASILVRSLEGNTDFVFVPFRTLFVDSYYLGRIWFTIWQATISTIMSVVVALPIAYFFARCDFPGKTFLKALCTLPFVMPTIVVAMGFLSLFGAQGLINTLLMKIFELDKPPIMLSNTLAIIIIAHVFYNYAVVVRIVSSFWSNLDSQLEDTAKILGGSRIQVLCRVTLPLISPALISSSALAFAFSFTSLGVVLVLGGPQFATLEVSIYELTTKLFRLPLAAALSVVQLGFTYLVLFVYTRYEKRASRQLGLQSRGERLHSSGRPVRGIFIVAMLVYIFCLLSPLGALVFRFFAETREYLPSLFIGLFSDQAGSYFYLSPIIVIWNSVKFALCTVIISTIVGVIIAYRLSNSQGSISGIFDSLFMMPLGMSAVTLGYGYLISFNRDPFDLRGSWIILVIAHSIVAYPFVVRSVLPVINSMDKSLKDAAKLLGASQSRIFLSVELPIILPAILVGATFAFAVSMGEFGSSLMLLRPENATIPIAIFKFLGLPGEVNVGRALAMSGLLMIIVSLSFMAIEKFRYKGSGGF